MATKPDFVRIDPPVRTGPTGGAGRSYSPEQLAFFDTLKALDRTPDGAEAKDEVWYQSKLMPDVPKFVGLLRSFANWMTDKQQVPTGVKTRIPDADVREAYAKWQKLEADQRAATEQIPGVVSFSIGARGKPRGKGAKKAS